MPARTRLDSLKKSAIKYIQTHLSIKDPCNIANPDSADNSTYLACSEGIFGGWNATVMPCPGRETYFYERLGE